MLTFSFNGAAIDFIQQWGFYYTQEFQLTRNVSLTSAAVRILCLPLYIFTMLYCNFIHTMCIYNRHAKFIDGDTNVRETNFREEL